MEHSVILIDRYTNNKLSERSLISGSSLWTAPRNGSFAAYFLDVIC